MTAKALGVIEAIGLAAAIEAADAAAKAANVVVLGYENARGGGRITVKLAGDVGAVRAAVSAGSAAAMRVGKVAGCLVIPRPHDEIAALIAKVDRGRPRGPLAPPPAPAPSPDGAGAEPAIAVVEPEIAIAEPDDAVLAPAIANAEPANANAEPANANIEPSIANDGPSIANDEPAIANDEPAIGNTEPVIANVERATGNVERATGNVEPSGADAETAERRKPAAVKRGRAPKGGQRPTADSGEVEG